MNYKTLVKQIETSVKTLRDCSSWEPKHVEAYNTVLLAIDKCKKDQRKNDKQLKHGA